MRALKLALLIPLVAAAACDRPEGNVAVEPGNDIVAADERPAKAAQTASIMRPSVVNEVAPAEPEVPEPITATISFAEGGENLSEEAREAVGALLADPAFAALEGDIVLRGHSDSQGSDRANLEASQARAEAVRDHLVTKGVAAERIRIIALGEQRPAAPNANPDGTPFEEGRAKNRRVEIEVLPAAPAPPLDEAPLS